MAKHKFLPKPPKRLAVIDQEDCSGCAGSPACQAYCETVVFKKQVVDAIRTVESPEGPFELSIVEFDKCIGCALCVGICPWDAITMYPHDEAYQVAPGLTLVGYQAEQGVSDRLEEPSLAPGRSPAGTSSHGGG